MRPKPSPRRPEDIYDKPLAQKMVANLFTVRNAVDPSEAYRAFRGRDATKDALLRDRGFPAPAASGAGTHRSSPLLVLRQLRRYNQSA